MIWWQLLNLLAFLGTLAVNGLASTGSLNGQSTGQVADGIRVLFTPAGYVFAIWGPIYLGLIALVVYQLLPARKRDDLVSRMGAWFIASCVLNGAWLFLWHYERVGWSTVAMLGLLGSLIGLYLSLGIGTGAASKGERRLVHLPISIYLGWISVATVANVSSALFVAGWGGLGLSAMLWTIIMMAVAAALAIIMMLRRGEVAFPVVVIWALLGIAVRHATAVALMVPAAVLAVVVLAVLVYRRVRGAAIAH